MSEPVPLKNVRLDDLIAGIRAAHDDPLDQLAGAMVTAEHLGEIADHLIGHFVDQARRAGSSWTDIGARMGVSKQAAQKRFVPRTPAAPSLAEEPNPFSRFTPRARNVITEAHNLALAEHCAFVTPEHLARGLVTAPESLADLTLRALGTDLASLAAAAAASRPAVESPSRPPDTETDARSVVPYDDRSRSVLEATVATAVEMGHDFIGTEHLLLALFTDPALSETLSSLHVDPAGARRHIVELLAEQGH